MEAGRFLEKVGEELKLGISKTKKALKLKVN